MAAQTLNGRSRLGWLLREFIRFGVTDFLLLTNAVPADLQASLPCPVRVTISAPSAGLGDGLLQVQDQLEDRFLLCDGSTLFDLNIANLLADAAMDTAEVVGRVEGVVSVFRRAVVDHLSPACCLEADVWPDLIRQGLLRVTVTDRSVDSRRVSPADIVVRLRRRAVFLDRDGVLNIDHGYVGSPDRFEWVDGALDAIRYASEAGWHVFIVTNQSGVARGLYTEDAVRDLLDWIAAQARAAGGTIDDVRFCPFHPEAVLDAYRQIHPWRKPMPGMLLDLIRAWDLDPERAVMVGDQATDMAAAAAAGVAGHLFRGGNLFDFLRPILDA